MRALLGTASHFCEVVVLNPQPSALKQESIRGASESEEAEGRGEEDL